MRPAGAEIQRRSQAAEKMLIEPKGSLETVGMRPSQESASAASFLASASGTTAPRPRVQGKFIFRGDEKLYIRGVTYGTFRPDEQGRDYPSPQIVDRDFAAMAESGINAVRTYTVPPRWLLDLAHARGLVVMIGLPWEQHIAFLEDKKLARDIEERLRHGVRSCAAHPAVLCYVIGNEIPASIVRWYGRRRIENFLERLYRAAKSEDPEGLVTYVNYPTTEYLQLPFIDFISFNVYLESRERLAAYLARLQNLAGDRPLILAELGMDSARNGEEAQARALDWQVRTTFAAGCSGVFVFSWTDEWCRGGYDIEGWNFGLTRRDRCPKPALAAVSKAFAEAPFPPDLPWPRISVVVCSYNGSRTIGQCLKSLRNLAYPDYEVIVVDDGSSDRTASIAREHGASVISTANRGLSDARNTGMEAATGEIVAYIDDDAYADPHWLTYLAATFLGTSHAGVGGPNLAPAGNGEIAECVANSPGGPTHVLLSDTVAEHIPGCNSAFRKTALQAIGGFDRQFRAAGDDVDVCWRLQEKGWTLGFSPAAVVWHQRRNSIRSYWKQQAGYGKAEALLEGKWPAKYNSLGHLTWAGRLYGQGITQALGIARGRIYHGTWGTAPFQSLYQSAPSTLYSLPFMPEWFLVNATLAVLAIGGAIWKPLLLAIPLLALSAGAPLFAIFQSAAKARFPSAPAGLARIRLQVLTAFLHMLQPLARLKGRCANGLTPWRGNVSELALPRPRFFAVWSERWQTPEEWMRTLERLVRRQSAFVVRGGDFDDWDLEVRCGLLGAVRTRMALEEHGAGRQLIRFQSWPRCSVLGFVASLLFVALCTFSGRDQVWSLAAVFALVCLLFVVRIFRECGAAKAAVLRAIEKLPAGGAS